MTMPSPDITLSVDLRNPGQFFACCGVLELASRLWLGSEANGWQAPEGWFAREGSRASFHVATYSGHNDPLGEIVRKLIEPDMLVELAEDHDAHAPDLQPILIATFGLRLDWWLHRIGKQRSLNKSKEKSEKSELKIWAGQQTPERNVNSARAAWREIASRTPGNVAMANLLAQRWPMSGRFGFDPKAAWNAQDVGHSPDEQGVPVMTSPSTEILAAIGLQRCRPAQVENKRRWFAYRAWADPLAIALAPAAMAGAGRALAAFQFPVVMRNAQYGSFRWAKPLEVRR